ENISAAVEARAQQIEAGVRAKGYETMVRRAPGSGSGIVSFRHPEVDSRVLVSRLREQRISAAPRQGWVRAAPHFYIGPEDIERALAIL
ncbi:MAG: aminotransferase class V-fold PLP-dependent enzyme, partial [Bryobacteraceae bacterium]